MPLGEQCVCAAGALNQQLSRLRETNPALPYDVCNKYNMLREMKDREDL